MKNKEENAITLVALIITIIILIILSGISIVEFTGKGLFEHAKSASNENEKTYIYEEIILDIHEFQIEKIEQNTYEELNLENFKKYLLEKKEKLIVSEFTNEKLVIKYKEYNIEIDSKFQVNVLDKMDINVFTVLEPNYITNGRVTITMNIQLQEGVKLKSVTPLEEEIEVIEENEIFRVSKNGIYKFEIITTQGKKEITEVEVKNIDTKEPEVNAKNIQETYIENEITTIDYEITDDNGIDTEKCKYIFTKENKEYEKDNVIWNDAENLKSTKGNIEKKLNTVGEYYLHILAIDKAGNYKSFLSDKITVKKGPLYLFDEGMVEGYTWIKENVKAGNISEINNNSIYFKGNNSTWLGACWKLNNVDLSNYTQIHFEVSTGTYLPFNENEWSYRDNPRGISIIADKYTTIENRLVYTKTSDLSRQQIDGNIGSFNKTNTTLYLEFSRWNPGCYVHKIWVD